MIDRSFYAYTSESLPHAEFEERFARFQGKNSDVLVEYVSSDFMSDASEELAILEAIFVKEGEREVSASYLATAYLLTPNS